MNATTQSIIRKLDQFKPWAAKSVVELQQALVKNPTAAKTMIGSNPELAAIMRENPFLKLSIETL